MRRLPFFALVAACMFLRDSPLPPPLPPPPLPTGPASADCEGVDADLTVVTFNAGLGPGMVRLSSPRVPAVAQAVAGTDADVLCLQEVWTEPDERRIVAALGLPRANVLTFDTEGLGEEEPARCGTGRLDALAECARNACASVPAEEQTLCALRSCENDLLYLYLRDRRCLDCLASGVGRAVDDIVAACEGAGMSHVYGGRNGVILASRWPLKDKDVMLLPASNANRVALFARVDVPGRGPVQLACTHISSPQRISPSHGFDDWESEQAAQLRLITERLRARAGDGPAIFAGDMNFGPRLTDEIEAASGNVWNVAVELGYASVSATIEPPFCTVCPDNTLRGRYAGRHIDHVLEIDPPGGATVVPRCADRLFMEPRVVTGHDGEPVSTHLSDHYGVRVKIDLR